MTRPFEPQSPQPPNACAARQPQGHPEELLRLENELRGLLRVFGTRLASLSAMAPSMPGCARLSRMTSSQHYPTRCVLLLSIFIKPTRQSHLKTVASRTIIWSLVKQLRMGLVPVLHRLHRRFALER